MKIEHKLTTILFFSESDGVKTARGKDIIFLAFLLFQNTDCFLLVTIYHKVAFRDCKTLSHLHLMQTFLLFCTDERKTEANCF